MLEEKTHGRSAPPPFLDREPVPPCFRVPDLRHATKCAPRDTPPGWFTPQVDRAGHQTNATYDATTGRLLSVSRTRSNGGSNTVTETYDFSYTDSAADAPVATIVLNRHTNGNPDIPVRQVMFSYYDGS